MPRRKSARDQRAERQLVKNIAIVTAAVVILGGLGALYLTIASSRRATDPETLCLPDPVSSTVVLVDVTDPLSTAQRQDLDNQFERLLGSIPRSGRVTVMRVDPANERLLTPVVTRCNPGTGQDENETTGNPAALERARHERFEAPLAAAIRTLASTASGAAHSPILESIQSVALTELQAPRYAGHPRKLVVVSDLLQNTQDVSFYQRLPAAEDLIASAAFRRLRTDLRDVRVEFWMLQRPQPAQGQGRALIGLWDRIISAEGGSVDRAYNVSG